MKFRHWERQNNHSAESRWPNIELLHWPPAAVRPDRVSCRQPHLRGSNRCARCCPFSPCCHQHRPSSRSRPGLSKGAAGPEESATVFVSVVACCSRRCRRWDRCRAACGRPSRYFSPSTRCCSSRCLWGWGNGRRSPAIWSLDRQRCRQLRLGIWKQNRKIFELSVRGFSSLREKKKPIQSHLS